jgi:hypothetical protein
MGKRLLICVAVAASLAFASTVVASSINVVDLGSPGVLGMWFVLAPMLADMLLQPEPQHRAWVWLAVYFVFHLGLIGMGVSVVGFLRRRGATQDTALQRRAFEAAVSQYHLQEYLEEERKGKCAGSDSLRISERHADQHDGSPSKIALARCTHSRLSKLGSVTLKIGRSSPSRIEIARLRESGSTLRLRYVLVTICAAISCACDFESFRIAAIAGICRGRGLALPASQ